jgi:D-alanyl-D-alanine carboxypeptidase
MIRKGSALRGESAPCGKPSCLLLRTALVLVWVLALGTSSVFAELPAAKLQRILDGTVDGERVSGVTVCVVSAGERWTGAAGDLAVDRPYYIASTTKLYTTAIVVRLVEQGRLGLDDPLGGLLPDSLLAGLHVYKGVEYSRDITVRQLLSQTSGLPDYFSQAPKGGTSLEEELLAGHDRGWSAEEAVAMSRAIPPHFAPGTPGKAYYSDTNYQLLGRVIEHVTGRTYAQALDEQVLQPLGLNRTWLQGETPPEGAHPPAALRYRKQDRVLPQAMASFGPDGGIVSTAEESMVFLRSFFGGGLFPTARLAELQHWNRIFTPFRYGTGLMRFEVPRLFSPFKRFPPLIGHSGLSGAFAFYSPEKGIFLTGTVNRVDTPSTSFKLMLKMIQALD